MGVLTHDLSRLRNEILALRSARQGLIHDLERETGDRRAEVSQMLANFSKGFGAVARRTKADRLGAMSELKRMVGDVLTGVRTDLSGVREAWLTLGAPARCEAGANAEGRPSGTGGKRSFKPVGREKPVRKKFKH